MIGAATNWAAFVATMVVSFFLAPYLIHKLGDSRYGIWSIVEAILAYFTLLDMGIAVCLVRFVARHHAIAERDQLNKLVSACLAVFCVAAIGALALGAVMVPFVAPGLEARANQPGDVAAFMLLMLANLALTLPLSVFPTILDGLQRFGIKSAVRLVFLAIRVAGILVVMEHSPALFPLAVVFTITNLLEHAVMIALSYRFLPGLQIRRSHIDRATLRQVKGSSIDAFLAMLAGRITVQTGAIVVGGFLTAAAAGHYAIASRLVEMAKNLLRSITATLTPAVSEREARGDHDGVRQMLLDGTRYVLYLVIPVHLGLLLFGRPFLQRWVGGEEYAQWCYPVLVILSATLTIGVAQSVASRILYGLGQLRLFARLALVEAALNLVLSLVLVNTLGLKGVAYAVAIPNVLFCLVVIALACRTLQISAMVYLKRSWLQPLLASGVPTLVWLAMTPAEATWSGIGMGIATGLVPYLLVVIAIEVGLRSSLLGIAVLVGRAVSRLDLRNRLTSKALRPGPAAPQG